MGSNGLGPFTGPIKTAAESIATRYGRPRPVTPKEIREVCAWARIVGIQEEMVMDQRRTIAYLEGKIRRLERRPKLRSLGPAFAKGCRHIARFLCDCAKDLISSPHPWKR